MNSNTGRTYRGDADSNVFVEGPAGASGSRPLKPRLDLYNHSPTGFAWGYGGSGPAQLALALAADVLGDDKKALRVYQTYKLRVIGNLPFGKPWGPISEAEVRRDLEKIAGELASDDEA